MPQKRMQRVSRISVTEKSETEVATTRLPTEALVVHRCSVCNDRLAEENVVYVEGRAYHAHHFACYMCENVVGSEQRFLMLAAGPCCEACYSQLHAPRCSACTESIMDKTYIRVLGTKQFHLACYKCACCHQALTNDILPDGFGGLLDRDCYWGHKLRNWVIQNKSTKNA